MGNLTELRKHFSILKEIYEEKEPQFAKAFSALENLILKVCTMPEVS
jgi:hypothetical protein